MQKQLAVQPVLRLYGYDFRNYEATFVATNNHSFNNKKQLPFTLMQVYECNNYKLRCRKQKPFIAS